MDVLIALLVFVLIAMGGDLARRNAAAGRTRQEDRPRHRGGHPAARVPAGIRVAVPGARSLRSWHDGWLSHFAVADHRNPQGS